MENVFIIVQGVIGLLALGCYIMVLVSMFSAGDTGLGVGCGIGFFVCGLGVLAAFIMGWVKVNDYEIKPIMLAWTGAFVVNIMLSIVRVMVFGA